MDSFPPTLASYIRVSAALSSSSSDAGGPRLRRDQPNGRALLDGGVDGILAPPLLLAVLIVANDRKVMGRLTNGPWTNVLGWSAAAVMFAALFGMIVSCLGE